MIRVESIKDYQFGDSYKAFPESGEYPAGGMSVEEILAEVANQGFLIEKDAWSFGNADEFFDGLGCTETIAAIIVKKGYQTPVRTFTPPEEWQREIID